MADQIEASIVGGEIPAGSRLGTKEELRRRYDVAYGTLNEALRILQQRGYVTSRTGPGGGLFASSPNPTLRLSHLMLGFHEGGTLADCEVVRHALELELALDAARSRAPHDVAELRAIFLDMAGSEHDPAGYLHENWRLHRRIAQTCSNRVLGNLYLTLLDASEAEVTDVNATPQFRASFRENLDVHRQLIDAIEDGSEELVRRAIRAHRRTFRIARRRNRQVIPA